MAARTRLSLILRLRDPEDTDSWAEFVCVYGPFVYSIARGRGLQDADACDLVQDVMREVSRSVSRFEPDPAMGKFRGWLGVITRRVLARFFEKSKTQVPGTGGTAHLVGLSNLSVDEEEERWDREFRAHVFRWAAERVRGEFAESTWRAFWLTAVEGVAAREAAEACEISVGAVYIAKSRVLSRLRERAAQAVDLHLL
ncbi:MAG: sigma-70 family RNA polymerase sigma factor [Planctomycetota bacterium]